MNKSDERAHWILIALACIVPFAYVACFPNRPDPRLDPDDFEQVQTPHPFER